MASSPEGFSAFLARHPTVQYCLLVLLGVFGVYLSMPIDFGPESTIKRIDLVINVMILVPSILLIGFGGGLAILSGFLSHRLDEGGRAAKFVRKLLKSLGIPGLQLAEFTVLGPFGFVAALLTRQLSGRSISGGSVSSTNGDSETE